MSFYCKIIQKLKRCTKKETGVSMMYACDCVIMQCVSGTVMMQPYVYSRHDVMRLWPCHDAVLCLQLSWCDVCLWLRHDAVLCLQLCHDATCVWLCHNAVLCPQLCHDAMCVCDCVMHDAMCVSTVVIMVGLRAYIFILALVDGRYSNLSSRVTFSFFFLY